MSYSAAVGLLTSIKLLTGVGLTAISEHASRLAADLAEQTAPLGWALYRVPGERSASARLRCPTLGRPPSSLFRMVVYSGRHRHTAPLGGQCVCYLLCGLFPAAQGRPPLSCGGP